MGCDQFSPPINHLPAAKPRPSVGVMFNGIIGGVRAVAWHTGWSPLQIRRPRGRRQALVRQDAPGV